MNLSAKPRIILEMDDDGTISIEHYINGSRTKFKIDPNMLAYEALVALDEQKHNLLAQAERAEVRRQAEIESRHNRVYKWTAESHGVQFANRVINGKSSTKLRARVNETERKDHKSNAVVPVSVQDVLADLI